MDVLATIFDLQQVSTWIEWYGYPMLFLLLVSNGVGFPMPEDIPVLVAGALGGSGHMDLGIAAFVCWCGIIGGDCILYSLGRRFGMNITRVRFVGRHLTPSRIEKAAELFDRYGVAVVAVARMFPGVRAAMVASAGTIRFNIVKFLIAEGCSCFWVTGLVGTWKRSVKRSPAPSAPPWRSCWWSWGRWCSTFGGAAENTRRSRMWRWTRPSNTSATSRMPR